MKKFLNEFKEFALKGNVFDLAVGVLIGGAFQGLVKSLTTNIINPIIGLAGKRDLSYLVLNIWGVEIKYGSFLTEVINFLILALIVFSLVKFISKLSNLERKKAIKELEVEPTDKDCPFCFSKVAIKATRCPHCTSVLEEV